MPRRAPGSRPPHGRSATAEPARPSVARSNDEGARPGCETRRVPWRLLALLIAMTAVGPLSLNILAPAMPGLIGQLRRRCRHRPAHALALSARHGGLAARARPAVRPLRPPAGDARRARARPSRASRRSPPPSRGSSSRADAQAFGADRHRDRPRDHPRPLRSRPRRLDDRLGHHRWWCRADDRAADRRRARHRCSAGTRSSSSRRRCVAVLAWAVWRCRRRARSPPSPKDSGRFRADLARASWSVRASSATRCSPASARRCSSPSSAARRMSSSTMMGHTLSRIRHLVLRSFARLHGGQFRRARLTGRFGIDAMIWWGSPSPSRAAVISLRGLSRAARLGHEHDLPAADDHRPRQRPAVAELGRRRRQRAPAGGRHRVGHHRLHADGHRRRRRPARRARRRAMRPMPSRCCC